LTPPLLPRYVARIYRQLQEATGDTPATERIGTTWRLTMDNDRVRMTVDYARNGRGYWRWSTSTLTVDGQACPLARDFDHFVKIYLGTDGAAASEPDGPVAPHPLPPEADISDAPTIVAISYDRMSKALGDRALTLHTDRDGRRWIIALASPDNSRYMRCTYVRYGSKGWFPEQRVVLVIDGVDRSDEIAGNISKAMALMAAAPHHGDPQPADSPVRAAAGDTRPAPGTRKGTVMRN
jgi:hypothetical protein